VPGIQGEMDSNGAEEQLFLRKIEFKDAEFEVGFIVVREGRMGFRSESESLPGIVRKSKSLSLVFLKMKKFDIAELRRAFEGK
jgi:hypothetical protein